MAREGQGYPCYQHDMMMMMMMTPLKRNSFGLFICLMAYQLLEEFNTFNKSLFKSCVCACECTSVSLFAFGLAIRSTDSDTEHMVKDICFEICKIKRKYNFGFYGRLGYKVTTVLIYTGIGI